MVYILFDYIKFLLIKKWYFKIDFERDIFGLKFKPINLQESLKDIPISNPTFKKKPLFMPKKKDLTWIKSILGDDGEQVYF